MRVAYYDLVGLGEGATSVLEFHGIAYVPMKSLSCLVAQRRLDYVHEAWEPFVESRSAVAALVGRPNLP